MKKFILLLACSLVACKTGFMEKNQIINIDSNIVGLNIYVDNIKECTTPCSVSTSNHNVSINIVQEGYGSNTIHINKNGIILSSTNDEFFIAYQYNRNSIYIDTENQKNKFSNKGLIRHYVLINFYELKLEAAKMDCGEFITGLSVLTKKNTDELISIINATISEVDLAHKLTGIRIMATK